MVSKYTAILLVILMMSSGTGDALYDVMREQQKQAMVVIGISAVTVIFWLLLLIK